MANTSNSISRPRFYADIGQYLKNIGLYGGGDSPETWCMNPSSPTLVSSDADFLFNTEQADFYLNKLLHYTNNVSDEDEHSNFGCYGGVLGHNFASAGVTELYHSISNVSIDGTVAGFESNQESYIEIVNYSGINGGNVYGYPERDGFSLWEIRTRLPDYSGDMRPYKMEFKTNIPVKSIGSYTYGIFFEPQNTISTNSTIERYWDGVSNSRTEGGADIFNFKYSGAKPWVDTGGLTIMPWGIHDRKELEDLSGNLSYEPGEFMLPSYFMSKYDYSAASSRGRKSWTIKYLHQTDDDLFNKTSNPHSFFTFNEDSDSHDIDLSMETFFKLTLGGNLPFIFQPDSRPDKLEGNGSFQWDSHPHALSEFALCKIEGGISYSQKTSNSFEVSFKVKEVW